MTTTRKRVWEQAFLKTLAQTANVQLSCHAAKVSRKTVYQWRDLDPEFAAEWDTAIESACDLLEAEALKRAKAGSDTLMMFLLKSYRPARFRETHRTEISGPNGGPIDFRPIADALDAKLALIAARVGANGVSHEPVG